MVDMSPPTDAQKSFAKALEERGMGGQVYGIELKPDPEKYEERKQMLKEMIAKIGEQDAEVKRKAIITWGIFTVIVCAIAGYAAFWAVSHPK